ncbi:Lrp/AsnC family transcriptional regulator [Sphingomonas sp. CL5.1]|uniref:Lrp/AsnC family transcriptional regulator n=1 Tax=Sphingomonas sp. CL5.1 TaxID=2653203 RepID=UPI001582EFED|nr:Lrp/AsnC family transcriptional regulator [Sphingomonas sp. CL5.1]QKS01424.1 Lrp/AsnC family transcriptional regulator [Sphingomonas sp. CL5.1]
MTLPQLDDLDRKLIDLLSCDARVSNRKIAVDLGVTEGTVRGRIKRLQQDNLIAFTAITSFDLVETTKLAFIAIQADVMNVREIARNIADLPQVSSAMIMMGRFNILAICLFSELDRLYEVASDLILSMPGVHHVETSIAVRTVKYDPRIVRITNDALSERPALPDA